MVLNCNEDQKALLDLGDWVIQEVKSLLGPNPLNQWGKNSYQDLTIRQQKINEEEQGLIAFAHIWANRDILRYASDEKRKQDTKAIVRHLERLSKGKITNVYNDQNAAHRPKVVASAIAIYNDRQQSTLGNPRGMCQDYAALGYLMLKENLDPSYKVSYIFDSGITHFFCAIGDFQNDRENTIIVDPWYVNGKAVLWEHSRHGKRGWGEPVYIKDCTGEGGVYKNLAAVLTPLQTRYEEQMSSLFQIPENGKWYNETVINYQNSLLNPNFWLGMQYLMSTPSYNGEDFSYVVE